jgi:hypothetical protein
MSDSGEKERISPSNRIFNLRVEEEVKWFDVNLMFVHRKGTFLSPVNSSLEGFSC